ncbi:uncharacterized protein LOC111382919 [Olea europaea var. sylvestris]|uniref:uncharacterized protein LOC111382919 n=1 Tax=Olea europaea var. sylvestris TaxID=158386 RepID=UPI000C1CCF68|nr:uncharacterized protein LOC111382919 [Olea europaea var. sylvestris]
MASDSNFVQAAIPRFDGHYDHWSMLMENFLWSKEYWSIIEFGIEAAAAITVLIDVQKTELEVRKLKDLKVKNYLFQAIDRPILETILCKETSKDIWDFMKKKYQGSARVKRAQLQALRRDFETLQMKDGESITSYNTRTMEISSKMRFHESKDIDAFSLDELQSSPLVHEQKMNKSSTSEEQALKASTSTHLSNSRRRGRGRGRGRGREDRGNRDASRLPNDKENEEQSNFATNEVETLLMTDQANQVPDSDVWYVDTGCSNHMCGSKSSFSYLNEGFHSTGYVITIQNGVCEIYDPTKGAIAVVKMSSKRMFPLKIESVQSYLVAEVKDSSWLWHFRYGHLSFGRLKTL